MREKPRRAGAAARRDRVCGTMKCTPAIPGGTENPKTARRGASARRAESLFSASPDVSELVHLPRGFMDIRCVVTGQNTSGKSVFVRDAPVAPARPQRGCAG